MNLAVLASHEGTTLQALLDACVNNELAAQVSLVISNNSGCGALRRANQAGVTALHISTKTHGDENGADSAMCAALCDAEIDWVLLLGYMKKLGGQTLQTFSGRILNTHPSLLPKFGGKGFFGRKVHEAVIAAGESRSGATLHYVDAEYDKGPILAQTHVQVSPGDNAEALEERVKLAEQQLLVSTIARLIDQRSRR